ncbi:MDR family MFS transporter [Streptomyces sp. NPDC051913]|uniref:MDR family MFS transporter n=1 Tax=Streptomyces sp. NPDC051913 TaxID=3365676 RepID=UPI0037D3E21E
MPATVPATAAEPSATPKNVRWVMLGVMLAMLLSMLDNMVVSTAMPTVVAELGGLEHISWVVTAYTLVTAVTTPIWGKLGDLVGRKSTYLTSIAVFIAGSALCGAAESMGQLIAFRVIQAVGAGGIGAGAFALIGALVPPRERGKYQGMTAAVMAIGTVGGPLFGGFVTGHFDWRWAFYINLPIGLLALVWLGWKLHVPVQRRKVVFDWPGIATLTVSICALVLAASWAGTTYAWASWQILGLGAAAVLGLVLFVLAEKRAAEPLVPLTVFTNHRNFPLAMTILLAVGVVTFGAGLYLPLFQQTVQGASATNSGLLMLPMMVPVLIVSTIAGKDADTSRLVTSAYMVLVGIGLGFAMQMAGTIAQNSVSLRDMGAASSSISLFRTLGGSLGVAVFGSLFTRALQGTAPTAGDAYLQAVSTGTSHVFLTAAILCALSVLAALFVIEVPLKKTGPTPAADRAAATA